MKRRVLSSCMLIAASAMLPQVSVAQADPTCCPEGEACPPEWWPAGLPFPDDCIVHPPLVRISAEEAFEAYQAQELDGQPGVMMIDVRTPEEVYWVGAPAQVNLVELANGDAVVPDGFKALLQPHPSRNQPHQIEVSIDGKAKRLSTAEVVSADLTPIAYNVPVEYVDPMSGTVTLNPAFGMSGCPGCRLRRELPGWAEQRRLLLPQRPALIGGLLLQVLSILADGSRSHGL